MSDPSTVPYPQRNLARGYRYQDSMAALSMAGVLAEGSGAVVAEVKRFKGDVFDDVTVFAANRPPRRAQVKHFKPARSISRGLFADDLEFDRLLTKWAEDGAVELRILTTLTSTEAVEEGFARAADVGPFAPGLRSTRWRLPIDEVWPDGGEPRFPVPAGTTRAEVAEFCRSFVVEADAMPMSASLADPGELEFALVAQLIERVGVEQYPNRFDAVNVASRLLEIAGSLRTRTDRRIDFTAIAGECGLRIDRGRVAQAFPLDRRRYVPHVPLAEALRTAVDADQRRIVVQGPPGAGKSWALEALAQDLRAEGWIVARHYCFLEPGDPEVAQRVAVEAMTANLTAELLDNPRLADLTAGLGGDLDTLAGVLDRADDALGEERTRIVLIVDGLDHAARIEPRSATPDDLAAQLGLLELGGRVTLIVGSQPGAHLQTLLDRGAPTVATAALEHRHTAALLARQGVLRELRAKGFADDHAATIDAAHRQAAGNPLYVGFLGREVLQRLRGGEPRTPSEVINALAGAHGNLEAYYRHLLTTAVNAPDEGVVAEHLALLDFPVTMAELVEILPMLGRSRLERVVEALRPILDDIGTQGGLRIHHESFRRFIVERLAAEGRPLRALLDPIVTWLDGRGFFRDGRAFRSLLALLRRAGRDDELLSRIGPDFVSRSVVELQPQTAIEANLRLAAGVAADAMDFPALTRVAELRAAVTTTFREKLSIPTMWAEAVIELDGGVRLAERLLYDGRTTWPRETGLRLCAVVDRAGTPAPWREYLALRRETSNQVRMPEEDERYRLDELNGMLRTVPWEDALDRIVRWIEDNPDATETFVDGIADEIAHVHGPGAIVATLETASGASQTARCRMELRLAEALATAGGTEAAVAAGQRALDAGLPSPAVRRLLDIGVPPGTLAERCPDPEHLVDQVLDERGPDRDAVDVFLSAVLVAAASGADLSTVRGRLSGDGFYRAWLRFCCDLADARAGGGTILDALSELSLHDKPFVGRPRACDLYSIHGVTVETFRRAAELVPDADWPQATGLLLRIAARSTTSMQNNPSGPLTIWALLVLLRSYAARVPLDEVRDALEWTWRNQFYEFHAESSLAVGRLEHRVGDTKRADAALATAGRYLAAYGFHKDVTVFGLIEALEAVDDSALRAAVSERYRRLFPLCDRAYRHSDGRETSHAAPACFTAFARHSPGAAADSLARAFLEDPPARYDHNERGLTAVLAAAGDRLPAHLNHLLWRCDPGADIEAWLKAIDRLADADDERAREAFRELAAAADGDSEGPDAEVAQTVGAFAAQRGWPQPPMDRVPDRRRLTRAPQSAGAEGAAAAGDRPASGLFFDGADSALKLLVRLRGRFERDVNVEAFAGELLGRLGQVAGEQHGTVIALMEAFCHAQRFLDARGGVLARVAAAYTATPAIAAEVSVLAWIGTRDGWDPFGGARHRGLLETAFALDPDAALRRLAHEFAWHIQTSTSGTGITRRIAESLVAGGRQDDAVACWDDAAAVVEHRLPVTGAERASFAAPGDDLDDDGTRRAYARLLGALVHSSDPERRALALAGIAELLPSEPTLATSSVESVLRVNATFTDTLLVVRLLELTAPSGDVSSVAEWLPAIAGAQGYGLQHAGRTLLVRRGEAVPRRPAAVRIAARQLPEAKIDEALIWDARDRVKRLAALWHPFRRSVADRYWELFDADRERTLSFIERQADTQFSASASWVPPWYLHRWEAELLEIAIHDAASELVAKLAASGRWPRGRDGKLHELLAADVGGAVARARSRTVRPTGVPIAGDRSASIGPPSYSTDEPFAGWLRVALVEDEIRPDEDSRSGTLTRVATGLWCGTNPSGDMSPFLATDMEWRWHTQRPSADDRVHGRAATHWNDEHLVLYDSLLSFAPAWLGRLGLRPAPLPRPLDLIDETGAVSAVVRCWRMRPYSYEYSPPSPMIRGTELLLQPALADTMRSAGDLTEVTRVKRHRLVER